MKHKTVDLSKLTPEQRQALGSFYADCKQAAPHISEMRQTMQDVYSAWLSSPTWSVNEGPKPEGVKEDLWHVKPEINYVDHIEGAP